MEKEAKDSVFNKGFAIGVVIGSLVTGFIFMHSFSNSNNSDNFFKYENGPCTSEKRKDYAGYEKSKEMRDAIDFVDEHFGCSKKYEEKISLVSDAVFQEKMKKVRIRFINDKGEGFGTESPILQYVSVGNELAALEFYPEKLASNSIEK
ncbi:MAG TPA: hypothetical protein PLJ21_07970 [Pseudobdellovibrionaceae bacterium]|nr:hypothetical protein [Pseudobdellovibrionaceae bacterium]